MTPQALPDSEVDARLAGGWQRVDGALHKRFSFPDYRHTMAFVNAVAEIAQQEDHHPELGVHYAACIVRWSTHSVRGISERDFDCAARVDALVDA